MAVQKPLKREAKAAKKVKFNEAENQVIAEERKWNDSRGKAMIKGSFTKEEL